MSGPTETIPLTASSKLAHLKKVLDDIRTQSQGIEANLAQVLTPRTSHEKKTSIQLQKESKKLLIEVRGWRSGDVAEHELAGFLSQMQTQYDRVRATSLDSVSRPQTITSGSPSTISKRLKSVRFTGSLCL